MSWRQYRSSLKLVDTDSEDFGSAGLGAQVECSSVRLIILPSDPDATPISFDKSFWDFWSQNRQDPVLGRPMSWLVDNMPTSQAAVSYAYSRSKADWDSYMAIRRNGALEMELGKKGAFTKNENRYFMLISSIGKVWYAFNLYTEVITEYKLTGPFEVSLALIGTSNAMLGHVGSGWMDPILGGPRNSVVERNCIFSVELHDWPTADGIESLAFNFGNWIEDTWGIKERRYIALEGQFEGNFDKGKYASGL
jgi:hypothetical protein